MKRATLIVGLTVVVLAVGPALADPTPTGSVYLSGANSGQITDGYIKVWGDGHSGATGYGGIYTWTTGASTGEGYLVPDFGFCIELPQSPRNTTYDVIPLQEAPLPPLYGSPMGSQKADYLRELWGRHFNPLWVTRKSIQDKKEAEAFSAAVWEIVYEDYESDASAYDVTTWDGTGTSFRCEQADTALANQWLHSLTGDSAYFAPSLRAATDEQGQDFLVQIPAPGAFALGMIGLALVGTWARRRLA